MRVLLERGELTAAERERIKVDAEHARLRWRGHAVTSPPEAAARMERSTRAREDEAIEIGEVLEGGPS